MKLYYNPISPNCRRVTLTAAYLGLPYDEEILDLSKGEHKTDAYMALNPNGMVPTLVDGDLALWESRSIIEYLARKKPESGLLGESDEGHADVSRWVCWDAAHLAQNVTTMLWETVIKGMLGEGDADQAVVAAALEQVKRFFAVLDKSLEGKQYLVGDALTIADLSVAATLTYTDALRLPVDDYPNLKTWFGRIKNLDAWQQTQPQM